MSAFLPAYCANKSPSLSALLKDIYLNNPNVHWDDIIGLQAAKRLVKEAVVYPIKVAPLHLL